MKLNPIKLLFVISTAVMVVGIMKVYDINLTGEKSVIKKTSNELVQKRVSTNSPPLPKLKEQEKKKEFKYNSNASKEDIINHAAYQGDVDKIRELILDGLDINTQDSFGQTPLMSAIAGNQFLIFNMLMEEGANIEATDNKGQTALVFASSGAHFEMMKKLLQNGADPNIKFNSLNFTLLMDSSTEGNMEQVEILLRYGARVNQPSRDQRTALMYAAREGHLDIVKVLLQNGADKELVDSKGLKAYDYAMRSDFKEISNLLR